ncbi:ABC transporter permease [Nakamurella flavida]|uniref:Oligopeptide transport system permease protein OppC n=1 Tax=Nakamurella flavida TaxID=363630 RepID=A0A938YFX5_9ACTN|nr:ABC transporter permease [Nakamurella flavida]MBM9476946.1 ABC transporter permease [Nakamurella flavida]MDP9779891.1 peptide/nickel transport system permease protein [Nakamurella flavida]
MTTPLPTNPGHVSGETVAPEGSAEAGNEQSLEQKEVAGLSQGQIVRRRFFRHKGAMVSLFVLILILLLAVTSIGIGPIRGWYTWTPFDRPAPLNPRGQPTLSLWGEGGFTIGTHPFGQDEVGRDMFAATMKGIQNTMVVIIVLGLLATTLGIVIGAVAGYFGGWADSILMRFTDMIIIVPLILIAAVAGFAFNARGVFSVALVLGLFTWTGLARLVRAEFLALREREFVDAARVGGASSTRIIFKHILPNTVGVVVVNTTLLMGAGILTEAALGFLGFGIQPPNISLGSLISQYQGAFTTRPWLFVWPGFFIVVIVLCIQFIGDGLRDAFDPRQKRIPKQKDLAASAARTSQDKA